MTICGHAKARGMGRDGAASWTCTSGPTAKSGPAESCHAKMFTSSITCLSGLQDLSVKGAHFDSAQAEGEDRWDCIFDACVQAAAMFTPTV